MSFKPTPPQRPWQPRTPPFAAIEGRIVKVIPPPQKSGRWRDIVQWHRQNPLVVKLYERVPRSTPRYLKNVYGMVTYSRNNRGNRCDMYMHWDPTRAKVLRKRDMAIDLPPVKPSPDNLPDGYEFFN